MQWLDDPCVLPLADAAACRAHHPSRYVLCGWYARALERWFAVFPREQCLVLISEEMFADPEAGIRAVLRHIGMPEVQLPKMPKSRDGGYADWMPVETERELRAFFKPRNRALATLLERELPWE
jgi:hypothetical protein